MALGYNGPTGGAYSEQEIEEISADALRAVREPLEQLEEVVIWFVEANDAVKAASVYAVWAELNREKEELLANLLQQEVDRATAELQEGGVQR